MPEHYKIIARKGKEYKQIFSVDGEEKLTNVNHSKLNLQIETPKGIIFIDMNPNDVLEKEDIRIRISAKEHVVEGTISFSKDEIKVDKFCQRV